MQQRRAPLMAVLVFASNSFVQTRTMPGPLRAFADHQPVTATVNAVRALLNGGAIEVACDIMAGHAREGEPQCVLAALDQEIRAGDEGGAFLGGRLEKLRRVDVVVA